MSFAVNITMGPSYSVSELLHEEFWKKQFPDLSMHSGASATHNQAAADEDTLWVIQDRVITEGYFSGHDPLLAEIAPRLASAIEKLERMKLPPVFLFLFDEPWECFYRMHPILRHLLGDGYKMLPDFWMWCVKPDLQESGWTPHRDKGACSLAEDGSPLSLTMWIPLSDANPLNSCIYLVPANLDPTYNTPAENDFRPDLASIRALPGKPGDYFCWNQAVLHWGSRSSPYATHPRMSMAFEFQRGDIMPFRNPLLTPLKTVTFEERLKLVAKQILQYRHMYTLAPELEQLAQRIR